MDELNLTRSRIDAIDEKILELLKDRFAHSKKIGRLKHKPGLPVTCLEREKEVLQKWKRIAREFELDEVFVLSILRKILKSSKEVQL